MGMKKLILVAALVASTAAHAEFKDGNSLYDDIRSSANFSQGVALGYIMGVTDALRGVTHCVAENVTAGQIHDMVQQYLKENPSLRHFTADLIVSRVLGRVWPCPKKGGSL